MVRSRERPITANAVGHELPPHQFWMSSIEKINQTLDTPAGVALNPVGVPAQ
jgi:hypothetical protein